jgi:hypothetical protein
MHLKSVRTIPHPRTDVLHFLEEGGEKLVVYLVLHDDPRTRDTRLARSHERCKCHSVDRSDKVGIVEDNNWSLETGI